MVGELEVIFRIDTITLRLRVTCQVLVLFKKLGSVAARTVIDAITRISAPAITLRARVVPTATAAGLSIIVPRRSSKRRVGKEWVRTGSSRGWPLNQKKKQP